MQKILKINGQKKRLNDKVNQEEENFHHRHLQKEANKIDAHHI